MPNMVMHNLLPITIYGIQPWGICCFELLIVYARTSPLNAHSYKYSVIEGLKFGSSLYLYNTLCLRAAKARTSLWIGTGSPEHSLLYNAKNTQIACADRNYETTCAHVSYFVHILRL